MINKIYASDMDGTFLREDHSFDKERFRRILNQFKEKGYLFVAASGRSMQSLKLVFEDFVDEIGFVAENGSIVEYQGQTIFMDDPISPEIYLPIIAGIDAGPFGSSQSMVLSGLENFYLLKNAEPQFLEAMTNYYAHFRLVDTFEEVREEIIKINAKFSPEEMDDARRWLNDTFEGVTAMTTGFDNIDIIPNGSNKSVGLSHLCAHFGIARQDVVAFGDNQNDLDMFDFAGLALATENAREDVKAKADSIIGHCNDGAVLAYLEEEVNGN
ncbi:Cof-type HAD-IIB family hydrolase [Streptococcus suis]|uniref:Cof-type HAD-IIB family hydrolase n=1 Tax=Streptococcus suis TaxID=1307 RepID=UPI00041BA117|nr:Cof-type HAD-IIB family hydrolase [Streptococcus suis]HEL9636416.1 HAD family hydrolase [Streptococcus suis]HEM6404892.1 HAD family hydrolase [Streptococcus suis]